MFYDRIDSGDDNGLSNHRPAWDSRPGTLFITSSDRDIHSHNLTDGFSCLISIFPFDDQKVPPQSLQVVLIQWPIDEQQTAIGQIGPEKGLQATVILRKHLNVADL